MLTIIWAFKEFYSFSNSNIKDHRPQIARANIMTMKMFEILGASPKCDIETGSEQMLLEKWHWRTYSSQGCHKPLICKKHRMCWVQKSTVKQDMPVKVPFLSLSCFRPSQLCFEGCPSVCSPSANWANRSFNWENWVVSKNSNVFFHHSSGT